MIVHPDFFRRGIAQELLQFVLELEAGAEKFVVATGTKNTPAIKRRFSTPIAQTEGEGNTVLLTFEAETDINHVMLMEAIAEGERVRTYVLEAEQEGQWVELVKGSAIGHKKIDRFETIRTKKLRLRVTSSVGIALIRSFVDYYC